jgi:SAM-dependent methyltransferase
MDERELWDRKAEEWAARLGDDGDPTRKYETDPVLWQLAGDVRGVRALDAGCGTGYLTIKLAVRGAKVVAVDYAPKMVEVARRRSSAKGLRLDFRIDDCQSLSTVPDASIDLVVSNFVLMDVQDLDAAVRSMARVLRDGGCAVVVMIHPCFQPPTTGAYFDEAIIEERWGAFSTPFIHHHRPLQRYLNAFIAAGLRVDELREPSLVQPPPPELDAERIARWQTRPFTIAFRLVKAGR